jgi:hypothetical protein
MSLGLIKARSKTDKNQYLTVVLDPGSIRIRVKSDDVVNTG